MHSDSNKHDPFSASSDAPGPPAYPSAGASIRKPFSAKGVRYTPEHRQEVVDFVNSHNAIHGRGGQSEAARKYNLSLLTIAAWLKKSRAAAVVERANHRNTIIDAETSNVLAKMVEYMDLGERIKTAEAEIVQLRARHESLAAQIRQSI